MVAAVETMMYIGETPWHSLGNKIDESKRFSLSEGLKSSGLDWEVKLEPLFLSDGTSVSNFQQAVRRTTDNAILGTVGPRYTPLQNKDMFKWFEPMFDARLCGLNTAGSLFDGTKVWILADILGVKPLEVAKNDLVNKYLMISNSHDGSTSVRVSFVPIRVVCWNTMNMALNSASSKILRLRHQKSILENLDKVREIINLANQEFEATGKQYQFLASKRILNAADLHHYVRKIVGIEDGTSDNDIPTKTQNTIKELLERMINGKGQDNPVIRGTWWAAYNGISDYLTWSKGRTVSNRLDNLWFGTGAKDNKLAFDLAMEYANAA